MDKIHIVKHIEKLGLIIESSEVDRNQYKFYCHDKKQITNRFFISIKGCL